jgi:hypothetical protein
MSAGAQGEIPASSYVPAGEGAWRSTALTRGPWDPSRQHAGPPIALAARAMERAAQASRTSRA